MIVTLCSGSAFGQQRRDDRVAGLVIRAVDPIELAERDRSPFDPHQHLVARFGQIRVGHLIASGTRGKQRRLVDDIGQICAREAGRSARDRTEINRRIHRHPAGVHAKNRLASFQVGIADRHLPIEAARPQQRRIENVLPVGGGDDDDADVRLEAVHLDEQLVQCLFAFLVTERIAAAAAADRIELVDEDDARLVSARIAEQPPDTRGADARIHLDEIRAAREQERHARFTGDRSGEQRLAGSRRADEQDAFRNVSADGREPIRMTKEIDDLLHFILRLVHPGDILEGDDRIAALGDTGSVRNLESVRPSSDRL